jgi:PadR family transcriptional regulator, regulatory protein PadR
MRKQSEKREMLQGTMDLLILRTLMTGPAHGHTIANVIERTSDNVLQVEQGSLISGAASVGRPSQVQDCRDRG